ncbi:right-handed parallel beta-helix repeat-containing protein [Rhizobium bangladeshense]|uniref:right-handed parallel beta-helix repeat-containing protein n=1 Tax=Rhizobium bangladeshense TaxID=1138189 RepID=UPI001C8FF9C9|nr:right-handed parallel beta-helix repeat-containing protein [Rhizobium bangladeshense]MBY3595899.1 right-handed parallel beta-helix repeat-containing protein [Rhizobium bangladeshense]
MRIGLDCGIGIPMRSAALAPAPIYYVDPAGSDSSDGLSPATAWQTLGKVNAATIPAGSQVLFKGGVTFSGSLMLREGQHFGAPGQTTIFGSYGTGNATIQASLNSNRGLDALNPHHVTVRDLIFVGTGQTVSTATGCHLVNDLLGNAKLSGVSLLRLDISGYGVDGIAVYTGDNAYAATSASGFDGLLIDGCLVHDCTGNATDYTGNGITIQGLYGLAANPVSHTSPVIRNCKVYNNTGTAGITVSHSGSGILLGQCSGALVEYCEAYNNGANNTYASGPVGIWFYECLNSTIQFCESHHNKTGVGTSDGGGFDIDGGCQGCTVQYCYSHDNYGSGYQIYQFSDATIKGLSGNTIRFNISENDGTQAPASKGGVLVGTAESNRAAPNNNIHNNTIYNGLASANGFYLFSNPNQFSASYFANNIVYTTGTGSKVINSSTSLTPAYLCIGNCYSSPSTSLKWGSATYTTFSNWRTAYPAQETVAGSASFKAANPSLVGPLPVGNIGGFDPLALGSYKTQGASVCRNGGQNINSLYGIDPGPRDLFGNAVPQGVNDIGCFESA